MKSGEKLRAAQIAALEGRAADVRAAGDAHRRAIGEAVAEAERLAGRGRRQTGRRRARPHVRIALARHHRSGGAGTADRRATARRVRSAPRRDAFGKRSKT